jgi:hypothetical protein
MNINSGNTSNGTYYENRNENSGSFWTINKTHKNVILIPAIRMVSNENRIFMDKFM